jgi:predicted enzyme related to lactoylglutathione lyase
MGRVIHFEIHAVQPARAIGFYKKMFGWTFTKWGDQEYWLIGTGATAAPGINGGLILRRGNAPAEMAPVHGYVCTIDVDNLDDHMAKLTVCGGAVAMPRFPIPTIGWLAYGKDTEGNVFGMMQADPDAK